MAPKILVGNTSSQAKKGSKVWKWTLYVQGATEYIDHVDVSLHPTFAVPIRSLSGPPFKHNGAGWGTFPVLVAVFWKSGGSFVTQWELQFGKANAYASFDVPPTVAAQLHRPPPTPSVANTLTGSLREAFLAFDFNGDGMLDLEELGQLWAGLREDAQPDDIPRLFASIDTNGDGRVSAGEFAEYLCATPSQAELARSAAAATPHGRAREILRRGDVKLLSAAWLLKQPAGFRIRRSQDLPKAAFVPPGHAEVLFGQASGVVVISYGWLSRQHPDPHGFHLKAVLNFLQCLRKERSLNEVGVFWDFASLPQIPRSEEEDLAFKRGLQAMNLLYGGRQSLVVQLKAFPDPPFEGMNGTPYDSRGWCVFEEAVSGILKDSDKLWDLSVASKELQSGSYERARNAAVSSRQAPMPPCELQERLESLAFTNGADRALVAQIYTDFFAQTCARADALVFSCPWNWSQKRTKVWGPREAERLAQTLPSFRSCRRLYLNGHAELGCSGPEAEAMAASMARMPGLAQLILSDCRLGDGFLARLLDGDPGLLQLRHLWLGGNDFSADGLAALQSGLERLPGLVDLRLPIQLHGTDAGQALRSAWSDSGRSAAGLQWV